MVLDNKYIYEYTSGFQIKVSSFDSTFVPEQLCLTFESTGLRPGELHG